MQISPPPPTNTSKIHLYVEQFSLKLTGDWQKDSCTNKAVRKLQAELGRKEREAIRSGPVALGEDSEERKITKVEILPGE